MMLQGVSRAIRDELVKDGDMTLGIVSHRLHVSCQALIEVIKKHNDVLWIIRRVPMRDSSVGLTSMGMARSDEDWE